MSFDPVDYKDLYDLEARLGHKFKSFPLLLTAVTHQSYASENHCTSNERLEHIGDSVYNLLISEHFYKSCASLSEGSITHLRQKYANAFFHLELSKRLSLQKHFRLGRQFINSPISSKMVGNLFEAVLGAIFIDGGYEAAQRFFNLKLLPIIEYHEKE